MELLPREEFFPHWILFVLLGAVLLISGLKYLRPAVFQHFSATYVKPPSTIPQAKEHLSLSGKASWMLLLNYFITSSVCTYMMLLHFEIDRYYLIFLPTAFYFYQVFALYFAVWISGETRRLTENILLLNFTYQNLGLFLIPVLIAWLLNVNYSVLFINITLIIFVLFATLRLIRGFFFALRNKVLWYYIILYLCSLEIWPLIVLFKLLSANLKG